MFCLTTIYTTIDILFNFFYTVGYCGSLCYLLIDWCSVPIPAGYGILEQKKKRGGGKENWWGWLFYVYSLV